MHEPFFQVNDPTLTATVSLEIAQNLSFSFRAFCVSIHRSYDFHCKNTVFVNLKALERSAKSAVTHMAYDFVLTGPLLLITENHPLGPHEMVGIFAPVDPITPVH